MADVPLIETTPEELAALRSTFEEHAAQKHGWSNFTRTEDGYTVPMVQLAWAYLRMGYFAGKNHHARGVTYGVPGAGKTASEQCNNTEK